MMNQIILHIPHSSSYIPEEYKNIYTSPALVETELRKMTDWYTDELFDLDGEKLIFPISRLLCDVERFRNKEEEEMAEKGMWVCYTHASSGELLANISQEHEQRILNDYYDKHHWKLTNLVRKYLQKNGQAVMIDCHSFSSIPLPHEKAKDYPRPDLCIGMDSYHTPIELVYQLKCAFEEKGYSVDINNPFAGTIVPIEYYGKNPKVISVMIEINRSLYMNEVTGKKKIQYQEIKKNIENCLIHAIR